MLDPTPDKTVKKRFNDTSKTHGKTQKTAYLLGNPINAENLRISVADAEAGRTIRVDPDSL